MKGAERQRHFSRVERVEHVGALQRLLVALRAATNTGVAMDRLRRFASGKASAARLGLPPPPLPPRLFESHRLPDTNPRFAGTQTRRGLPRLHKRVPCWFEIRAGGHFSSLVPWGFRVPPQAGFRVRRVGKPAGLARVFFPAASLLARTEKGAAPIAVRRFPASPVSVVGAVAPNPVSVRTVRSEQIRLSKTAAESC
jgi:hypothetical protein